MTEPFASRGFDSGDACLIKSIAFLCFDAYAPLRLRKIAAEERSAAAAVAEIWRQDDQKTDRTAQADYNRPTPNLLTLYRLTMRLGKH
jgi:hypothetical protein